MATSTDRKHLFVNGHSITFAEVDEKTPRAGEEDVRPRCVGHEAEILVRLAPLARVPDERRDHHFGFLALERVDRVDVPRRVPGHVSALEQLLLAQVRRQHRDGG